MPPSNMDDIMPENIQIPMSDGLSITSSNQLFQEPYKHERRSLHLYGYTRLSDVCHVDEDIVRRMAVQRRTETLLVEVVANETNATSENEQTIQSSDLI